MLRHPRDVVTVIHVLLAAVLLWMALAHSLYWMPVAVFVAMHLIAVEHNHAHLSVFRSRALTFALDQLLLLLCGMPILFWKVHHLGNHHRFNWTEQDWSSPFNFRHAQSPEQPVSYRYYQLTYYPLFCFHSTIHVLRSRNPRLLGTLVATAVTMSIGSAILVDVFGVWRWLAVMGTTYLAAGLMLGAANYLEHYSVHEDAHHFSAWTYTCRIHNLLSYNGGYHLLHHLRPSVHWSDLPHEHAADPSYAHPHLIEAGLFPGYRGAHGLRRWLEAHAMPAEGSGLQLAESRTAQ